MEFSKAVPDITTQQQKTFSLPGDVIGFIGLDLYKKNTVEQSRAIRTRPFWAWRPSRDKEQNWEIGIGCVADIYEIAVWLSADNPTIQLAMTYKGPFTLFRLTRLLVLSEKWIVVSSFACERPGRSLPVFDAKYSSIPPINFRWAHAIFYRVFTGTLVQCARCFFTRVTPCKVLGIYCTVDAMFYGLLSLRFIGLEQIFTGLNEDLHLSLKIIYVWMHLIVLFF